MVPSPTTPMVLKSRGMPCIFPSSAVELVETPHGGRACRAGPGPLPRVRLVTPRCQVDYAGRPPAPLPMATRLLMVKGDGSVLIHSDGGSYKPLNWMSP